MASDTKTATLIPGVCNYKGCGLPLPQGHHSQQRYCNSRCKQDAVNLERREKRALQAQVSQVTGRARKELLDANPELKASWSKGNGKTMSSAEFWATLDSYRATLNAGAPRKGDRHYGTKVDRQQFGGIDHA